MSRKGTSAAQSFIGVCARNVQKLRARTDGHLGMDLLQMAANRADRNAEPFSDHVWLQQAGEFVEHGALGPGEPEIFGQTAAGHVSQRTGHRASKENDPVFAVELRPAAEQDPGVCIFPT